MPSEVILVVKKSLSQNESVAHTSEPAKTQSCKDSIGKRSSQENDGNFGGAAKIASSGGRVT